MIISAQTSSQGEYEVYTREVHLNSFAYFTSSFELPSQLSGLRLDQKGISYSHNYELTNIGNIVLSDVSEIRFSLRGVFRIGATISERIDVPADIYPSSEIKYYSGSLDVFSIFITPQFTHIIGDGTAMTIEFGFGLVNIGGDAAFYEDDLIGEQSVYVIKIIPVAMKPGIFFVFGRSGLGIGGYLNPMDILNFIKASNDLYEGKNGIQTINSFYKRYEFQIVFTF